MTAPYKRRHAAIFPQVEQFCYSPRLDSEGPVGGWLFGDPHDTRPIPEGAKFEGKCTFLGEIGCSLTSMFSGDAGYERRWACIAFVEPNGTKVEQCGSVPGSSRGP